MNKDKPTSDPMKQINQALGLFLLSFGIVVLISVFFTETTTGRIANTVAGVILGGIGGGMILSSRLRRDTH